MASVDVLTLVLLLLLLLPLLLLLLLLQLVVAATQPEEDAERLEEVTLAEEEARAALVAAQNSSPTKQGKARIAFVDAQQRKAKVQQNACLRRLCEMWGRALQRARRHSRTITMLLLAALVLALLVRAHRYRDEISAAVREEVVPRLGEEWSRVVWANSQATRLRHYLDSAVYAATHSPTLPPSPPPPPPPPPSPPPPAPPEPFAPILGKPLQSPCAIAAFAALIAAKSVDSSFASKASRDASRAASSRARAPSGGNCNQRS
jgi:hypothetical protein